MELFLEPSQNHSFLIELLASYLKLEARHKLKVIYLSSGALKAGSQGKLGITSPTLITSEGQLIGEAFAICRKLVEILPQWKGFFLGKDEAEAAAIASIKSAFFPSKDLKQLRKKLQKHLQFQTFFISNHLTFADFYMFSQLYDSVTEMTDEQKLTYNHIFRWYKHIQNLSEIKEFLTKKERYIVNDPVAKIPFLVQKKVKKEKTEKKKQDGEKKEEQKKEKVESLEEPKQQTKATESN